EQYRSNAGNKSNYKRNHIVASGFHSNNCRVISVADIVMHVVVWVIEIICHGQEIVADVAKLAAVVLYGSQAVQKCLHHSSTEICIFPDLILLFLSGLNFQTIMPVAISFKSLRIASEIGSGKRGPNEWQPFPKTLITHSNGHAIHTTHRDLEAKFSLYRIKIISQRLQTNTNFALLNYNMMMSKQ
ncbi:hypothetical protein KI387_019682, partial [Taxus chinensis]